MMMIMISSLWIPSILLQPTPTLRKLYQDIWVIHRYHGVCDELNHEHITPISCQVCQYGSYGFEEKGKLPCFPPCHEHIITVSRFPAKSCEPLKKGKSFLFPVESWAHYCWFPLSLQVIDMDYLSWGFSFWHCQFLLLHIRVMGDPFSPMLRQHLVERTFYIISANNRSRSRGFLTSTKHYTNCLGKMYCISLSYNWFLFIACKYENASLCVFVDYDLRYIDLTLIMYPTLWHLLLVLTHTFNFTMISICIPCTVVWLYYKPTKLTHVSLVQGRERLENRPLFILVEAAWCCFCYTAGLHFLCRLLSSWQH